ncbi:TPA: Ger(x)C family spore germination protein [Bacillus cereus]
MRIKDIFLSLSILCIFFLSGCWDYRELNQIAFAMAIGIDKVPHKNEYRISFQIVNAKTIASEKGAIGMAPIIVYSSTGKNLLLATRKASKQVPRKINAQHTRAIIIGEQLAKEGIRDVVDLIERDPELRVTTTVLIAKNSDANTILKTLTPIENIPANAILGKLNTTEKIFAANYSANIDDVIRGILTTGGGPIISGIQLTNKTVSHSHLSNLQKTDISNRLSIQDMAIFKKDKLVGWIEGTKRTQGLSWINNKMKGSIVALNCGRKKEAIAIEIFHSKTKIKAEFKDNRPLIRIHITERGAVGEAMCAVHLSDFKEIHMLEQQWENKVKLEVQEAIKKAQRLKTDVLGFGVALERDNPQKWNEIKNTWREIFPTCKVEVQVTAKIRRSGQIINPY